MPCVLPGGAILRGNLYIHVNIFLSILGGGQLYTWGSNTKGQLGLGPNRRSSPVPILVESLEGIPLAFAVCGGKIFFYEKFKSLIYCTQSYDFDSS